MVNEDVSPAFIIVSADDIAERAYEIYVDRGYADGFDREDWLRAERELKAPRPIAGVSQRRPQPVKCVLSKAAPAHLPVHGQPPLACPQLNSGSGSDPT